MIFNIFNKENIARKDETECCPNSCNKSIKDKLDRTLYILNKYIGGETYDNC